MVSQRLTRGRIDLLRGGPRHHMSQIRAQGFPGIPEEREEKAADPTEQRVTQPRRKEGHNRAEHAIHIVPRHRLVENALEHERAGMQVSV